jgi:uncharacterized protein (TIGR00288 family)
MMNLSNDGKQIRYAVFVDHDNITISLQEQQVSFDYDSITRLVEQNAGVIAWGKVYLTLTPTTATSSRQLYVLWRRGLQPVYVPQFGDGETVKSLVDIQMSLDILEALTSTQFDAYLLVTGDGDFIPVIRKIAEYGVAASILAAQQTLAAGLTEECERLGFPVWHYQEIMK